MASLVNSIKLKGFPGGSEVKASARNTGDLGLIPGSERSPGKGNGNPLQYSCLESHGWRRLVGYSPQGPKELDTTERLHFLKEKRISTLWKHLQKTEQEGTAPNSFYEASIILIPKSNKYTKRK